MKELIKITEKDGQQLVSARELYLGLGLNKSNWSRWYPTNILENGYFEEGIDFTGVRHNDEGNMVQDFAITLDFAKHIAMMARTKKSHEYRNYFIQCEKKLKEVVQPKLSAMDQLRLQYKVLEEQNQRLDNIDTKIEDLEGKMTIDTNLQYKLFEIAKSKVLQALGGTDTPAYKELNRKTFSKIWRDYKRIMQVPSYKDTLVKDYEKGIEVLKNWEPDKELKFMIIGCNAQLNFKED